MGQGSAAEACSKDLGRVFKRQMRLIALKLPCTVTNNKVGNNLQHFAPIAEVLSLVAQ